MKPAMTTDDSSIAIAANTDAKVMPALRRPQLDDAKAIHGLIRACPPLDVNSLYVYLLLAHHHPDTCAVAQAPGGELQGFVSAYVPPATPDVLFVWQVAVHESARGLGLGGAMLRSLLERPSLSGVRFIETTVGPDNAASRGMFSSLARRLKTQINESALFETHHFGEQAHEEERLLRLGPLALPG